MALSEKIKDYINKRRADFPTTQALVIPLLHAIQAERGWISMSSMREAAEFLELPLMKIREVVTFYTMFNQQPVGKVHLQLCMNVSCWLNGSEQLMNCLEKRLNIHHGDTTSDGRYTLSEVECLGSCGTAPVLQVNEDYFENLDIEGLNKLMDQMDRALTEGKDFGRSTLNGVDHV